MPKWVFNARKRRDQHARPWDRNYKKWNNEPTLFKIRTAAGFLQIKAWSIVQPITDCECEKFQVCAVDRGGPSSSSSAHAEFRIPRWGFVRQHADPATKRRDSGRIFQAVESPMCFKCGRDAAIDAVSWEQQGDWILWSRDQVGRMFRSSNAKVYQAKRLTTSAYLAGISSNVTRNALLSW